MNRILTLLLLSTFVFLGITTKASHMMGGDLTYKCLGGMDYEITLSFYRDCAGISAPQITDVHVTSASCVIDSIHTLPLLTSFEVNPGCSNWSTTCNGGSVPGIEMYIYKDTITLGGTCDDWVISYELCCRNGAITNLVNPSSQSGYYQATLDNLNFACNSSPVFQEQPSYIVCTGQQICVINTAYEPDGDSLIYEMIDPMGAGGAPIAFNPPYSAIDPMPSSSGINFDASTGNLCVSPTTLGAYVVNFKVNEYRNGNLVGSSMRDMQIWVTSCPSSLYTISGTVSDTDSVAVNSGIVDIFEYDLNMGSMNLYGTQSLGSGGTYSFTAVPYGQYVVRATPDTINYPNTAATYHWNTFYWSYANVLSAFCDSNFVADVQLVGYGNLAGSGYLSGYLGELGVRSTIGDPFPGVRILVVEPGTNHLVASTVTDMNGNWSISGIPDGSYKIVVDVPGLSMISHHYVTINAGNGIHTELDYLAEPVGIIVAPVSTGFSDFDLSDQVRLYPNPTAGTVSILLEELDISTMDIVLMDLSGRAIEQWRTTVYNNKVELRIPQLSNGTYLIEVRTDVGTTTKQVNLLK